MSAYDEREVLYSDLLRAREAQDPRFASLVTEYLSQPDPPENAPEERDTAARDDGGADPFQDTEAGSGEPELDSAADDSGDSDDDLDDDGSDGDDVGDDDEPALSGDAWTLSRLRSALAPYHMQGKNAAEKQALRRETWDALLAAPHPPPRLRLGKLLVELYEQGDEWSRAMLMSIIGESRIGWGIWQGIKLIYKVVEERHDPELFGILAWRFDAMYRTETFSNEISGATFSYMRRRAWRYLRQLGQTVPEIYPHFAAQVLRHYPTGFRFSGCWIANQIWAHKDLVGARGAWQSGPPDKLDRRAFDDAWKLSPEPLLRLLEDAHSDEVCQFAIRGLRADFPDVLREVDPRWLGRIGKKPLAAVHELVVQVLSESPELHQSKLAGLGLHDMVIGLLRSTSKKAVAYAIQYAKAHAPAIPVGELIEIAEQGDKEVCELVRSRLAPRTPAELGIGPLVRMLAVDALAKLASEKLMEGFAPEHLTAELYVALAGGERAQQKFVEDFYKKHSRKVPAAFLIARLEDPNVYYWQKSRILDEIGKRKAEDIGVEWIKNALLDRTFGDSVAEWLRRGILKGKNLDVEWVKGLVMRPSTRALAIELLGNRKLVSPQDIGMGWLLAMARQADEMLSGFAQRYLLEHFEPDDFALDAGSTDAEAGIARVWSLLDPKQPEPVRRFAATYLRVHHPEAGPASEEARQLGIKPKLPRKSYTLARMRPLFDDASAEVRRMARALGRFELVRWDERGLLYELAAGRYREARSLAAEVLVQVGEPEADPKLVPPAAWLVPPAVFALAESPIKATREIALTLIRRHYDLLGGPHKLGWLMESPDREVRLFAVRLLWEKHRPQSNPKAPANGRFDSVVALQHFMRTVLFGLPPGRMERREGSGDALPDRPLSASIAKRRLVEVVRDMAVEEAGFAAVVTPVLAEFMHSQAKGEWQVCVAALAQIRHAHPGVSSALPAALAPATSPSIS